MTEKPICLYCGKLLRKQTHSYEAKSGTPVPSTLGSRDILQILRRKPLSYGNGMESVSVWCGEWGGYGDNFFCGLNCGYSWAVMRVEMSEKKDPSYVARFREEMKKHSKVSGTKG